MGKNCIICGARLVFGDFAFNQEICWDCFKAKVEEIKANPSLRPLDIKIIDRMLATVAEIHRKGL